MALEVRIQEEPDCTCVRLKGSLRMGPQLRHFGRQLESCFATRRAGVLLDFTNVEELDSSGPGELVILYTTASQHRGRLCLSRASDRVRRLLQVTKLSGMLHCLDDEPAAKRWLSE